MSQPDRAQIRGVPRERQIEVAVSIYKRHSDTVTLIAMMSEELTVDVEGVDAGKLQADFPEYNVVTFTSPEVRLPSFILLIFFSRD